MMSFWFSAPLTPCPNTSCQIRSAWCWERPPLTSQARFVGTEHREIFEWCWLKTRPASPSRLRQPRRHPQRLRRTEVPTCQDRGAAHRLGPSRLCFVFGPSSMGWWLWEPNASTFSPRSTGASSTASVMPTRLQMTADAALPRERRRHRAHAGVGRVRRGASPRPAGTPPSRRQPVCPEVSDCLVAGGQLPRPAILDVDGTPCLPSRSPRHRLWRMVMPRNWHTGCSFWILAPWANPSKQPRSASCREVCFSGWARWQQPALRCPP